MPPSRGQREGPPSARRNQRAPPSQADEYEDEYEEDQEPPPARGGRNGPRGPPPPQASRQKQPPEDYGDVPPVEDETKQNPFQKLSSAIDALPPGPKMIYIMCSNSLALVLVTLIGGLVFSGLERGATMTLNQEYITFMTTLQTQLSMVPNGNATYATLIGNYMDDPTQLVDFWGLTTHTLYLFAFTIVTTIGYGSFAPKTSGGQIFCICYILIAVPLGAVCLGKVAGTLLELMEWGAYCLLPRVHKARKLADKDGVGVFDYEDMRVALGEVQSQEIDKEAFMEAVRELDPLEKHEFGVGKFTKLFLMVDTEEMQEARNGDRAKVCSILVIGWLLLGTFVFKNTESWTFVEGFYFCMVTLTTIGFGDYVPSSYMGENFHFIYCIIGLGLVATFLSSISALLSSGGGDEAPPPDEKAAAAAAEGEGVAPGEYAADDGPEEEERESQYGSRYGDNQRQSGLPVMAMAAAQNGSVVGRGSGTRYRPDGPAGARPSGERGPPPPAQAPPQAAADPNPLNFVGNIFGNIPGLFAWPGQSAQVAREPSAAPPPPQQAPPPPRPAAKRNRMKPVTEEDY